MATVVKTESSTWKALVRRKGYPNVSKTFRTKQDASDWARRTEDEMARSVYIQRTPSEKMTLKVAMGRYLEEVSSTKSDSTQKSEKTKSKPLIRLLGDYSLAALTPDVIAKYRDRRLGEDAQTNSKRLGPKRKVSNSTVLHELALLSHLFTTAIQEWHVGLTHNPVQGVRKPSPGKGRNRRLSPEEEPKLLAAARAYSNPFLGWIVEIALETTMRLGEVSNLLLEQVDLDRRVVLLPDTKNGDIRLVPLSRRATEVLREAIDFRPRPEDCNLIFFGEPGKDGIRRRYEFSKAWSAIKQRLGMDDFRFHDLRHEAVSRLISAGIPDQQVAAISGHKSMQMLKRYTHLRSETLVAVLDRIQR